MKRKLKQVDDPEFTAAMEELATVLRPHFDKTQLVQEVSKEFKRLLAMTPAELDADLRPPADEEWTPRLVGGFLDDDADPHWYVEGGAA